MINQLLIALRIADEAHEGQMYGERKYQEHLSEVDDFVMAHFRNKVGFEEMIDLRCVAILHDVIEDTHVTATQLVAAGLNQEIVDAVVAITKVEGELYEDYIWRVSNNPLAVRVKRCDTAANLMNSLKEFNANRIRKYTKQLTLLGGGLF